MIDIRNIRDITLYILNNICILSLYSLYSSKGSKKKKKNEKNEKNEKNARYISHICYQCDRIIGNDCDLYFAFDMVYCSTECREKCIINYKLIKQ